MKRLLCALLALLLIGATACSQTQSAAKREAFHATVGGVELTEMPRRVVTMSRALTESVCALGFAERLVAAGNGANAPAMAEDLPAVGTVLTPDTEALLALSPDLVLTPAALPGETTEALAAAGCAVVVLPYAETLGDAVGHWGVICTLLAGDTAGENMAAQLERYRAGIMESLGDGIEEAQSAVFLMRLPNVCATGGTWLDDLLNRIGLENAAAAGEDWIYTPAEGEGYEADIIFYDEAIGEEAVAASVWQGSAAVQNGRLIPIDGNLLEAQTPRSLLAIAEAVHEAFPESDFPAADIVLEQEAPEEPEPTAMEKLRRKLGI